MYSSWREQFISEISQVTPAGFSVLRPLPISFGYYGFNLIADFPKVDELLVKEKGVWKLDHFPSIVRTMIKVCFIIAYRQKLPVSCGRIKVPVAEDGWKLLEKGYQFIWSDKPIEFVQQEFDMSGYQDQDLALYLGAQAVPWASTPGILYLMSGYHLYRFPEKEHTTITLNFECLPS